MSYLPACLTIASCLISTARTTAADVSAKPNAQWQIIYERGFDLWAMRADGSGKHRLIRDASQPVLLANPRKLAFVRRGNVFVASPGGANIRQVTHWEPTAPDADTIHGVSWHPSGKSLAVSRVEYIPLHNGAMFKPKATLEVATLYEVPLTETNRRRFYTGLETRARSFAFSHYEYPAWSPDGSHLAVSVNGDIWMATNSGAKTDENNKPIPDTAQWDMTRVGAVAEYDNPNWHGSRMNLGVTALSWSGNGKQLIYGRTRLNGTGVAELHLVTFKDEDKTEIAADNAVGDGGGYLPCFSPDGKWILSWRGQWFAVRVTDGVRVFYGSSDYGRAVW